MRAILLVAFVVGGCSDPKPPSNDPPKACKLDVECEGRGYCTEAGICRRDCYVDEHCIGPGLGGQCNSQGKCIEPADASGPSTESGSDETGADAPDDVTDETVPEGGA
ncbi:MAG: hypothetical protein ACXWUG_17865 [Polyangiales bacterium]